VSRFATLCLGATLVITFAARADTQDEARQVIRKAVEAQGGIEKLGRIKALTMKAKGSVLALEEWRKATAEFAVQYPQQFKVDIRFDQTFATTAAIEILDNNRGWDYTAEIGGTGAYRPVTKEELAQMKNQAYFELVSSLVPLLRDKGYRFEVLPAGTGSSSDVTGIKVKSSGHPDVVLSFSKKTALLAARAIALKNDGHMTEDRLDDYQEVNPTAQDAEALRSANISTEPAALLDYLAKQCLAESERSEIGSIIKRLGDNSFDVRQKAKKELVAKGQAAVPELRRATASRDQEIAASARECLGELEKSPDAPALPAVLRMIADAKPAGAAKVLLKYLPSAPNDAIAAQVEAALAVVGFRDGKPDPALESALKDKDSTRREVAEKLISSGGRTTAADSLLLLRGVLFPRKETVYEDGAKQMELEITEIKFYDRLDPKEFFRPKN
jgi:hypothetical protein